VGRHLAAELRRERSVDQLVIWDKEVVDIEEIFKSQVNPVSLDREKVRMRVDKIKGTPHPALSPGGERGFVTLFDRVEARQVDITEPESYRKLWADLQPDWVVHLAAMAAVPQALKEPELVKKINFEATREMLAGAKEVSPDTRFLIISTADIYGAVSDKAIPELPLAKARPRNPYAISKYEMEKMIEAEYLDRVIRVRPFPHIGPGQGRGFVTADFASQVAELEEQGGGVIKVGNLEAERDFTDVRDVVRAYRLLMERGKIGDVYNVASGKTVKISVMLDELINMAEVEIKVAEDPARVRPADVPVLKGDATKLREATGWQAKISWKQSLIDVLEWWRGQLGRR